MKIKQILLFLGIAFLTSGCFTYKSYVPIDLKEINLSIPLSIDSISIKDMRIEISEEEDIKIPFMSGLKRKAWKHHPKLLLEHKRIIENTIKQNFNAASNDTASLSVRINYACKEFEQTGKSEIERVYFNTELYLRTNSSNFTSSVVDTFHYESGDASNKHFEKFYRTSLRNIIVRNLSDLRNQYYNSEQKEIECFDSSNSKTLQINPNISVEISGKEEIDSIGISGELKDPISQNWSFKISTNQEGELTYIESLNEPENKSIELKNVMGYLYNLKLTNSTKGREMNQNCWKMTMKKHDH